MKKTSWEDLERFLSRLILGGATEVGLEFLTGFTVLAWKFPGQPGECLPLEMED